MAPTDKPQGDRIAKLLARAGVASRREIERMIADGRVARDGARIDTPATILVNLRGVTVDGNPVAAPERTRLFRFHKPAGLITAERDPAGRPTIYTALRNALPPGTPRLMPVGRLDFNTEGLLLLTNDGGFKREMELPATGVPRTYRARTYGDISQDRLEDLMDGIEIEGVRYGPIDANMERRTGRNQWVELTLTEGKNREVRRVLEHLGLEVSRLIRTAYGPFALGDLAKGQALEVRKEELERFHSSLKKAPSERDGRDRPAPSPRAPAARNQAPGGEAPRGPRRTKPGSPADGDRRPKPASPKTGERRPKPGSPTAGDRRPKPGSSGTGDRRAKPGSPPTGDRRPRRPSKPRGGPKK